MITNMHHSAFAKPPMSWRRKMSANTMITSQNHMMKQTKISIDQRMSRNG